MTELLIYLIGIILTYKVYKGYKGLRKLENKNRWNDVYFTIILSLFSWIGFGWVIFDIIKFHVDKFTKNNEPHKWL